MALAIVMVAIGLCKPAWLDDRNEFLREFVNQEVLATLGFIMAVTLASAASLHLELNKIEDETGGAFLNTRKAVKRSAFSLLILFGLAVVLVVTKPLLPSGSLYVAMANASALLIIYFNLSVLYDLTRTVFAIPAVSKIKAMQNDHPS